jgi:hypothetical protein
MLDYNLLFMLFIFIEGVQCAQGLIWIMFLGRWIGELCVVLVADVLGLQVYAGSFEASW